MTRAYRSPAWFRRAYFPDNLSALRDLQYRAQLSNPEASAFLGVTPRTLHGIELAHTLRLQLVG
jgi:hypothetical protein